jgi:YesN/AraC family two-component response regulator
MVKVMIVDNEATFRKGLKAILQNIGDVEIVAEASNGEEFLTMIQNTEVDIVFMDIKMPVMDGIEATRKARKLYPEMVIIGFSSCEHEDYVKSMMHAGANGYLSKSGDNYDLLTNIMSNPKAGVFPELNKKV